VGIAALSAKTRAKSRTVTALSMFPRSDSKNKDLQMQIGNTPRSKPYRLTFDDAVDVWLRHWRGEYQHDIAAIYGVNPGRINDVLKERVHFGSKTIAAQKSKPAA